MLEQLKLSLENFTKKEVDLKHSRRHNPDMQNNSPAA